MILEIIAFGFLMSFLGVVFILPIWRTFIDTLNW